MKIFSKKALSIVAVVVVIILLFGVGITLENPHSKYNQKIIKSLDEKQDKILALTAASTGASLAVSAIPSDIGSPISEELADIASWFAVALGAIFLEKYLLVIFQSVVFKFLLPIVVCALFVCFVTHKKVALSIAIRLFVFSIALLTIIPVSEAFSTRIYDIYGETIDSTLVKAENAVAKLEEEQSTTTQEDTEEDTEADDETTEETEDPGFIGGLLENAGNIVNGAKEGVNEAITSVADNFIVSIDSFKNILNNFIESLAIMIVTCCIIPIFSIMLILMAAKYILSLPIDVNGSISNIRKKIKGSITSHRLKLNKENE